MVAIVCIVLFSAKSSPPMSFSLTVGAACEVTELLAKACHLLKLKYYIGLNTCIKNF